MEILKVIDAIENLISKSYNLPLSGKCMIDRDELSELIRLLRVKLPEDLKQAKWILEEREHIIADARKEAGLIIKEAEVRKEVLLDEHEIIKQADAKALEIMATARETSNNIKSGTTDYAVSVLLKVEQCLKNSIAEVQSYHDELK